MATQKRPELKVEKRTIVGKKVKKLRKEGLLPASIYGKDIKSFSVQANLKEVVSLLGKVGETGLVDLAVAGEEKSRVALLKNPQYDPVSDQLVHLDLHEVKLTEKVTVVVPVELTGEAPAVERGEGILIHVLNEIEIETLPTELPEKFIADVGRLEKVGDAVMVKELGIDRTKITTEVTDETVIAKVEPLAKEEVVEKPAEAVPAEGAVPVAEGEAKPVEETKKEGAEAAKEEKPAEEKK